jgi:hypothetical protein
VKLIRSLGNSYTEATTNDAQGGNKLKRGLRTFEGDDVKPDQLVAHFEKHFLLKMRQTISAMDKIIKKKKKLRQICLQVYVDRTLLGAQLWRRLQEVGKGELGDEWASKEAAYRSIWNSKVHPYAKFECTFSSPETDDNGTRLKKWDTKSVLKRDEFNGRWHNKLWKSSPAETATAVFDHLYMKELRLGKELPRRKEPEVDYGLIQARARSIVTSTNDPRIGKALKRSKIDPDNSEVIKYFSPDIAGQLAGWVRQELRVENPPRQLLLSSDFGKRLSAHFALMNPDDGEPTPSDEDMHARWVLHDAVRGYYRDLSKSVRFRRAVNERDHAHIAKILPQDTDQLLKILEAKRVNAQTSEIIRLGKLIVHAADMPPQTAELNGEFQKRMDYFATSEGQSEIKRNEAFTRLWRNAVGLSSRTIRALVDPNQHPDCDLDELLGDPLGTLDVSREVATRFETAPAHLAHFKKQMKLIFGDKKESFTLSEDTEEGVSRASLFNVADGTAAKELGWTFIRLAAEIRNRTNHFNTKGRVESLIIGEVLKSLSTGRPLEFERREKDQALAETLNAFRNLLRFDISLQKNILVEELNGFGLMYHTSGLAGDDKQAFSLKVLIDELAKQDTPPLIVPEAAPGKANAQSANTTEDHPFVQEFEVPPPILTPKFIKLLRHAHKIARNHQIPGKNLGAYDFQHLDLENMSSQARRAKKSDTELEAELTPEVLAALKLADEAAGANHCKIGVLRLLYESGFTNWLAHHSGEHLKDALDYANAAGRQRVTSFEGESEQFYSTAEDLTGYLNKESFSSLGALTNELLKASAALDNAHRSYDAETEKQKRQTDRFSNFKLDVFAYLFGFYLEHRGFGWVWKIKAVTAASEVATVTLDDVKDYGLRIDPLEEWHSQFYAWLYLVPTDTVSLLRHQFRKTAALEYKSGKANDETSIKNFDQIDRLMALQVAVHNAGFNGKEHVQDRQLKAILYEDVAEFEALYSDSNHDAVFPGTRRGLRQVLRFGHYNVLQSIFEKHKITKGEFAEFTNKSEMDIDDWAARKKEAKTCLIEDANSRIEKDETEGWQTQVRDWAAFYQKPVVDLTCYRFLANGARLTEHANIHHLMMQVVGRLLDFTLTWERDSKYYFLGALYWQFTELEQPFVLIRKNDQSNQIGFMMPTGQEWNARHPAATEHDMQRFLPIWGTIRNFSLPENYRIWPLLNGESQKRFKEWFVEVEGQEPRDSAREKQEPRPPAHHLWPGLKRKSDIRNDFAHYNVVNAKKSRINLTYLTNAVRSLFGYDRKLKNAVSKAIIDILEEDGLQLAWEMKNDRLKKAVV